MYTVLAVMFVSIFFDLDPTKSFPLNLAARSIGQQLGKLIEMNVSAVNTTGWIAGIVDGYVQNKNPLTDYGVHMVRRLLETGTRSERGSLVSSSSHGNGHGCQSSSSGQHHLSPFLPPGSAS